MTTIEEDRSQRRVRDRRYRKRNVYRSRAKTLCNFDIAQLVLEPEMVGIERRLRAGDLSSALDSDVPREYLVEWLAHAAAARDVPYASK